MASTPASVSSSTRQRRTSSAMPPSATAGPSSLAQANVSSSVGNGPANNQEFENWAAMLADSALDSRKKLELVTELRDTADSTRDIPLYTSYLSHLLPAALSLLTPDTPSAIAISFTRDAIDQKLRHCLLTFIQKLPHTDPFRGYEKDVMDLMIRLLALENEENALVCVKVVIDGFRSHREQTEPHVEPFLDLVKKMYSNTKSVVEKEFGVPHQPLPAPPPPLPQGQQQPPTPLMHALHSPKVLTECPIAVVLIFQTFKTVMQPAMLDFYPLVMESIAIQPEPQRLAHVKAKEANEIFVGVAEEIPPTSRDMYAELIRAQVKTMAFLAYVLRGSADNVKNYLDIFPEACVRLLRDCPPEDVSTRKELLIATRHILTAESRSAFIPYLDILLDDRALVGTGVTSRETLRPLAYSVVADLIHHVRNELPLEQLARIVYVFSCNLNDATFSSSIQTMCCKLLNTVVESINSKGDKLEATRIMRGMFATAGEKLAAVVHAFERVRAARVKGKGKEREMGDTEVEMKDGETDKQERLDQGWKEIEMAMPIHAVAYANDSLELFCRDARFLFKTLLHTFRTLLQYTRQLDSPQPDGELLGRFFEHALRALGLYDGVRDAREIRDQKEVIDMLTQILLLFEPHVFSEVWTKRMDFFTVQALANPNAFSVLQILLQHETVSHQLVAILLKHLMGKLEEMGHQAKAEAALTLKLFKISFLAINSFIELNEPVLVPHLQKLIIKSFAFAAKAPDPAIYYQILRALFRSIGGGRFEALYKEVLPILQEMLDTLNYLLQHAAEPAQRDLFVELTLTVPVRLTNLLPHLGYLMKPLVHALGAGQDLVSQGLRTLELCIDNLTSDFLDPTMGPVLRELMAALHALLKPIPFNRSHANAAVKILGKLGGRNRRFQQVINLLEYSPSADEPQLPISFADARTVHKLSLAAVTDLARKTVRHADEFYRKEAVTYLKQTALLSLGDGAHCIDRDAAFQQTMGGLFDAAIQPVTSTHVKDYLRDYSRRVFAVELARDASHELGRRQLLPLTNAFVEAMSLAMGDSAISDRQAMSDLFSVLLTDFIALARGGEHPADKSDGQRESHFILAMISLRFVALCSDEDWDRKLAGVSGMLVFSIKADFSRQWVIERELEYARALFFILRDAPKDPPSSVKDVTDLLKLLIRTCHSEDDGRPRLPKLVDMLVLELPSQSPLVRETTQACIQLLAEVTSTPVHDLIATAAKDRLLDPVSGPIFNKPLRALPFAMQVGNIDAITYLLDLRPSLPDTTEEFVRLLHEVLALADVDDASLVGKSSTHKQDFWVRNLRVACLKLLKSTMACTDFLAQPPLVQVRSRIIAVYFKHVYSTSPEIVDVAHEGLRNVLENQAKLPKEVLQSGLRPILVNLADAKRLSVSGLEGLARFLELLTNYFKVEIGVKLMDHFKALADPQMLASAAQSPLEDNPDIARMTRLVNIFRLLPLTAVTYLVDLTNQVVDVEARLHQSNPGPFTENLGRYLDRYNTEAVTNLFENIRNPRFVMTYRNIIESGHAPNMVEELSSKADKLCELCFSDPEAVDFVLPGILLVREISRTSTTWLANHMGVLEALVGIWRSLVNRSRGKSNEVLNVNMQQQPGMLLEIFMDFLKQQQHIDLLFHIVEAFEIRSSFERSFVPFFLYQQVALQESVSYRREVLEHFFNLYDDDKVTWAFKTHALRLIVNPTLRMYFADPENDGSLITPALVLRMTTLMWRPLSLPTAKCKEDSLLIEIFGLSVTVVQHCSSKLSEVKKDVFKLAWMGINLPEPTVKLMAYVLVARFMAIFDTPVKFVRLTWNGLLRLKENEGRALYRQAIDILASSLPVRDPAPAGGPPDWATRLRQVLVEEGHSTPQLVNICELLVSHPDLFYDSRDMFVMHMANSLPKLGFIHTATPEMKKLAVDIVELIFRWERRRMNGGRPETDADDDSGKRSMPQDGRSPKRQRLDRAGTAASGSSSGSWAPPSHVREVITAHLLRLVSISSELVSRNGVTKRALDLFKEILGPRGLPDVAVKLVFFQRSLIQDVSEANLPSISNSAECVAVVAASKDRTWIRTHLATLHKLLEKSILSDEPTLHEIIRPMLERMLEELPASEDDPDADEDTKTLLTFVQTTVNDGLVASLRSMAPLSGTLLVLKCWLKAQPTRLQSEALASALLRVLGNLAKGHTAQTNSATDPSSRLIMSILDVCRGRMPDLRDQRRHLNAFIVLLIDKSPSVTLCRYVLDMLRSWVFDEADGAPTLKEKAGLLLRMAVFESRDEGLLKEFLNLILDIYTAPALRRTDLTNRLEPAFLLGTRCRDPVLRCKFIDMLEANLPKSLSERLQFLFAVQSWETVSDSYWIHQLLDLALASANADDPLFRREPQDIENAGSLASMVQEGKTGGVLKSVRRLIYLDKDVAHQTWVAYFKLAWTSLGKVQQQAVTPYIIKLLAKDHHLKQVEMRPNVIQSLLASVLACRPMPILPPHLVKYLAKAFDAWFSGMEILDASMDVFRGDDELREACSNALSELYASLHEEDMFYGLARSRCAVNETHAALTLEQNGLWPRAQEMYEAAQVKARNGQLPFTEAEYCLWEDHWILAAQKLQSWEILTEVARTEGESDLLLECAWRLSDWGSADREMIENTLAKVSDVATPRRKVFEAFTALIKAHNSREPPVEFTRVLDEAHQLAIRSWISLPTQITGAHLPLLQLFQQYVELSEASTVFESLQQTNASNLEARVSQDLKHVFQTWRDRLPNFWDDISVWSDLLAWRQHVFSAVTKVYVPLIPPTETATFGYRGYHETAWTINRFGHTARKHGLLEVCGVALNKIYSLPNIEISEAFLKLREQAMCFFQKPDKFNEGLDSISTTNLVYFAPAQKAEFLTLKGMFIAKLGQTEEANHAFAHAIQMDTNLAKAWAEWGRFNDKQYRDRPEQPPPVPDPEPGKPRYTEQAWANVYAQERASLASHAVACYLQAAGLYANHKSRALLIRVLWLLGLDDVHNTISRAFESYRGDFVVWYWITLIPQLLLSLSHREAKQARALLMRIAKQFPQALFYHLRTSREDFTNIKRQNATHIRETQREQARVLARRGAEAAQAQVAAAGVEKKSDSNGVVKIEAAKDDSKVGEVPATPATAASQGSQSNPPNTATSATGVQMPQMPRQPWELVEEILNILKTAFPLLALSMEKMVDQIQSRAKPPSDEDIYRFFAALLVDAIGQWVSRGNTPGDDGELNQGTKDNLEKFSQNLYGGLKTAIENDFMKETPKLREYIKRLQTWRDRYEKTLDSRPRLQPLDQASCWLQEFHHTKFDDVEVPGQYVQHVDNTEDFVKIGRFYPKIELARGHGFCFRRITMIGSNGSKHTFAVQLPAARHCRREERLTQLFRIMSSVLQKRKESRRRNLSFHLPVAIPLAPQLRLVENDSSYVSFQDIFDKFCQAHDCAREDSMLFFTDRMRQLHDPAIHGPGGQPFVQLRMEVMDEIQTKMVPETIMTDYMIKTMADPASLWLMRKQFAQQTASSMFLTYVACLSNRTPSRFHISRKTGLMYMSEVLPAFANGQPTLVSTEAVPFRLTPNMQHFITRVGVEGLLTSATTAIARSLVMPEFDLEGTLSLFLRDEILTWHNMHSQESRPNLTAHVLKNVDALVRRASTLAYIGDQNPKTNPNGPPVVQAVVTLISQASSPHYLCRSNETFMSWY